MGYRLDKGGHIDRSQQIHFRWNGRKMPAFAGDTVASALLANDVAIIGRGMKLHRPRGVFSIGPEEPNALVSLGRGAELEPSARATMIPVREGLEVRAQNAWPGVGFDFGRTLDRTAGALACRLLQQDFQVAVLGFLGAVDPSRGRHRESAARARPRALRRGPCALRPHGRRRRPAGLSPRRPPRVPVFASCSAEQDFECGRPAPRHQHAHQ
jgi:hypothetical protein